MAPRLPADLDETALTSAQRRVVEEVRAGRRGTVPANVQAWLPSPELARRAAHLGEFVRYETSLPARWSELAILVVAQRWTAHYEWAIHAREAARAGVPAGVIDAIGAGATPSLDEEAARAVYDVARSLVTFGRIDDAGFARATAVLGTPALVDLVGIVGYYTLVAFTLNAFDVPAPPGAPRLG